jgi:hypothetical protein
MYTPPTREQETKLAAAKPKQSIFKKKRKKKEIKETKAKN